MFLVLQDEAGNEVCRRQVSKSQVVQKAATELVDAEMTEIATRHSQLGELKKQLAAPSSVVADPATE